MFDFQGPNLKLDESAMFRLLENPRGGRGTVGAYMKKLGLQILAGSKAMVGVRSGKLKNSLHMRQGLRGRVQYVEVGSQLNYAAAHHEGTKPHAITSHEGRVMRFNVGGMVVYAKKTHHPGTAPNPYLTVPMKRVVRRSR
ncbi:MAG: hypothetical protein E6R04_00035 [Spirochaetes bacterium]|nr:MAG: hypothetical protein E6R04_00035 [Spirochaetota bacterium]